MKNRSHDEFRTICETLGEEFLTIADLEDLTGIDPDTLERILTANPQTFEYWGGTTYVLKYVPPWDYFKEQATSDYLQVCAAFNWLPGKARSAVEIGDIAAVSARTVAYIMVTRPGTFHYHGQDDDGYPIVSFIEN